MVRFSFILSLRSKRDDLIARGDGGIPSAQRASCWPRRRGSSFPRFCTQRRPHSTAPTMVLNPSLRHRTQRESRSPPSYLAIGDNSHGAVGDNSTHGAMGNNSTYGAVGDSTHSAIQGGLCFPQERHSQKPSPRHHGHPRCHPL